MKHVLLLILVPIILMGCNNEAEEKLEFKPEMINYFPAGTINHFPKKVPKYNTTSAISQNKSDSHPYIWVRFTADQQKFDSIYNNASKIAIASYQSEDSCLVVIDKHLREDNWYKYDKTLRVPVDKPYNDKQCELGKFALPNFYSEGFRETGKSLTGVIGYKMFVFEAKPGLYMDSAKLPNGLYTPKGWKHGFTKGVALRKTDNSVIYWFDIW